MSDKIVAISKNSWRKSFQKLKLINSSKLLIIEEEIEILREQIESLKQLLHHQNEKLQQTEQKLKTTNHELSAALNSEQLTLDEAKALAKNILTINKPPRDVLAEFLSSFYNYPVKAEQL